MSNWLGTDPDDDSVSYNLVLERCVVASFDKGVEGGNELLDRFSLELNSSVKLRPFENYVSSGLEEKRRIWPSRRRILFCPRP